jgi:hypothetical protein
VQPAADLRRISQLIHTAQGNHKRFLHRVCRRLPLAQTAKRPSEQCYAIPIQDCPKGSRITAPRHLHQLSVSQLLSVGQLLSLSHFRSLLTFRHALKMRSTPKKFDQDSRVEFDQHLSTTSAVQPQTLLAPEAAVHPLGHAIAVLEIQALLVREIPTHFTC